MFALLDIRTGTIRQQRWTKVSSANDFHHTSCVLCWSRTPISSCETYFRQFARRLGIGRFYIVCSTFPAALWYKEYQLQCNVFGFFIMASSLVRVENAELGDFKGTPYLSLSRQEPFKCIGTSPVNQERCRTYSHPISLPITF